MTVIELVEYLSKLPPAFQVAQLYLGTDATSHYVFSLKPGVLVMDYASGKGVCIIVNKYVPLDKVGT